MVFLESQGPRLWINSGQPIEFLRGDDQIACAWQRISVLAQMCWISAVEALVFVLSMCPPKLTIFWINRSTPKPTELSHSMPWGWSLQVCIPKCCSWPCCHCCLGAHSLGTAALTQASGSIPKAFVYVSSFSLLIFELLWSKPPCVPWQGFTEEMHWKKCEFSRRSKGVKTMGIFQKRNPVLSPFTRLEAWFTQKYVYLCWEATTVTPVLGALECPSGLSSCYFFFVIFLSL